MHRTGIPYLVLLIIPGYMYIVQVQYKSTGNMDHMTLCLISYQMVAGSNTANCVLYALSALC